MRAPPHPAPTTVPAALHQGSPGAETAVEDSFTLGDNVVVMKDGRLRAALKRGVCMIVGAEMRLRRRIGPRSRKRTHKLAGACRCCARCCEEPAIRADLLTWHVPLLRRMFIWWQERVNGLHLLHSDHFTRTFVFRCSHFDWDTRRCDSYATRPFMCRDYPRELLSDAWPDFFPECGYRPRLSKRGGWLAAIDRLDLPPEKKAELRRSLHIE